MTDDDLVLGLRALAYRLPAQPVDLVERIELAVSLRRPTARRRRAPVRRLLVAVLVLVMIASAAFSASDSLRSWLRARGIALTTGAVPPVPRPPVSVAGLGFGHPLSARDGRRRGIPDVAAFGPPDGYLLATTGGGEVVSAYWRARPDRPGSRALPAVWALLTVGPLRGANDPMFLGKVLSQSTKVEWVSLGPATEGVWIAGAPGAVRLLDGSVERYRLSANVLEWGVGQRLYRLETSLGRDGAAAIASALPR